MVKSRTLQNGMELIYMPLSHVQSTSVGVWIRSGSMYETRAENGASHFIEHMLFKGTARRTAFQIAEETDFVGGQMNAYTARDCTCFYTKTLCEQMEMSMDLLSDMIFHSRFDAADFELERSVILEEIKMYEDSPEDVAQDLMVETAWRDHPLGRGVAGTAESVTALTREAVLDYRARRYVPGNMVLAVAGKFDEAALLALAEQYFGCEVGESAPVLLTPPHFTPGDVRRTKDIEQAQLCYAFEGVPYGDPRLFALSLLNSVLGGGMSSRLFQSVRETHGLCYTIYAFASAYEGAGLFGIYAGLNRDCLDRAEALIFEEIDRLSRDGVTDYELQKSKSQLKANLVMGRESVYGQMSSIGKPKLLGGPIRTPQETAALVDRVTAEELQSLARTMLRRDHCVRVVVSRD